MQKVKKLINVAGPASSDSDGVVANKGYVDTLITNSQTFVINDVATKYLDKKTGGTMSGGINMDNQIYLVYITPQNLEQVLLVKIMCTTMLKPFH